VPGLKHATTWKEPTVSSEVEASKQQPGRDERPAREQGRLAAITGAGSGLGREGALLFADEGATVVVNDTYRAERVRWPRRSTPSAQRALPSTGMCATRTT
jgi:hypothetical protein